MAEYATVSIYQADDHVSPARACLGSTAVILAWTALFTNIVLFVVVITSTHGQHDHVVAAIVFLLLAVTILCATVGSMLLHPAERF